MNLPNKLSMLRICMIPIFVIFALTDAAWAQYAALAVFALASLTDMLDGKIARARNLVTNFGKFIDPIAAALVVLTSQGRMPAWVCIVMLAREFAISGLRLIAVENGRVIAAGMLGKIKTVTQMAAVMLLLLLVPVSGEGLLGHGGAVFADAVMYVSAAMTVVSGVDYLVRNRDVLKE